MTYEKTILGITTILIVAILAPLKAYAAGGFSVSAQEITLHPGESTSFTITASNSAGKINLLSSDTSIASIDSESIFLDMNSENVAINANTIGTATITVSASSNFATYDEEILEGQSCAITVNVAENSQADNDTQNDDIIDNQDDTETTETTEDTLSAPDTGNNSQVSDNSSQIALSSIIGASFAIFSFAIFCLYNRKKHAQK